MRTAQQTMTAEELLRISTQRRAEEFSARAQQLDRLRERLKAGEARRIRETARLTQAEMAQTVGVSRGLFGHWEKGIRDPAGDAALRYADLLDILEAAASEPVGEA